MYKQVLSDNSIGVGENLTPPAFEVVAMALQYVAGKPRCNVLKRSSNMDVIGDTLFSDATVKSKATNGVAISPDGIYLVRSGADIVSGSEIYVYNPVSEKYDLLKSLTSSAGMCYGYNLCFHPNGNYLAIFSGTNLVLFKNNGGAWDEVSVEASSDVGTLNFIKTDYTTALSVVSYSVVGATKYIKAQISYFPNDAFDRREIVTMDTSTTALSYASKSCRGFYSAGLDYNVVAILTANANMRIRFLRSVVATNGNITNTNILGASVACTDADAIISCSAFTDQLGNKCVAVVLSKSNVRFVRVYRFNNSLSLIDQYDAIPNNGINFGNSETSFIATQDPTKHYIIKGEKVSNLSYKSKSYTMGYDANGKLINQLTPNEMIFKNNDIFLNNNPSKSSIVSIYPWGYYL